jgi:GNAT superfamily N-acetyltransferase
MRINVLVYHEYDTIKLACMLAKSQSLCLPEGGFADIYQDVICHSSRRYLVEHAGLACREDMTPVGIGLIWRYCYSTLIQDAKPKISCFVRPEWRRLKIGTQLINSLCSQTNLDVTPTFGQMGSTSFWRSFDQFNPTQKEIIRVS